MARVSNRGTGQADFRYNGILTSDTSALTVEQVAEQMVGLAVTIDPAVNNGFRLSADNDTIDGYIESAEKSRLENQVTISVGTKGGYAMKILTGNAATRGTVAVGAGNGLIKTSGARTADGPFIIDDSPKTGEGMVVVLFK